MQDNRGTVFIGERPIKGDQCLHQLLGNYIDIEWCLKSGVMRLSSTKHESFSHTNAQEVQRLNYVPLKHGSNCPLLNPNIAKNPQRPMRPCTVVLLQNQQTKTILATQRPINISFGGKWVLPGGHLEIGEGLIQGGIRECTEEVGLQLKFVHGLRQDIMAWESVYTANSEVKSTGLVLFVRISTAKFEVVAQEGQVQKWEWRKMEKNGQPWGGGWAQGHLTYLKFINEQKR